MSFDKIYFDKNYMSADVLTGVITNKQGTRLLSITEDFLNGFKKALEYEVGDSYKIVLTTCGKNFGKSFAKRFKQEIKKFYEEEITDLPVFTINELFKDLFLNHGIGDIKINWKEAFTTGVFNIEVKNSVFSDLICKDNDKSDYILQGFLGGLFSELFGKDLSCYQTDYKRYGTYSISNFIISIEERMKDIESWINNNLSHEDIYQKVKNTN